MILKKNFGPLAATVLAQSLECAVFTPDRQKSTALTEFGLNVSR